jgi:selenocysteine lyase/cysteine desulfurase
MRIADARGLWEPETTYLNTASYGLPPRPAWDALQGALSDWHVGRTSWEHWGDSAEAARAAFARMCSVPVDWVAIGANASTMIGLVAAALPDGARVLSVEGEFTSALWPFMVQGRGVEVRTVPLAELAEEVDAGTDAVAFSAVQSSDGQLADIDAIAAAAADHGALTVVDATQACGWLPVDASSVDVLVCSAYKWLLSPRGSAFMTLRPEVAERLTPHGAGWYAGDDPFTSFYGEPLRLAGEVRRFDVSPAWFSWVGTAPAVELLVEIGIEQIHEHALRLANDFRRGLGLEPGDSAIVAAEVEGVEQLLRGSGVMAAARAGRLRTSWHVYNDDNDVARALEVVAREPAKLDG